MSYLILALATWRIMSLLYVEDGPYLIFDYLRTRIGVYCDADGKRQGASELAKAFNCPACLSVWVGGCVALSAIVLPTWVYLPLALSTGAIIIETFIEAANGKS